MRREVWQDRLRSIARGRSLLAFQQRVQAAPDRAADLQSEHVSRNASEYPRSLAKPLSY